MGGGGGGGGSPRVDKKNLNVNIINFKIVDNLRGMGGGTKWIRFSCKIKTLVDLF